MVDVEYKSVHALCNAEFNLVDFEENGAPVFTEDIIDDFNQVINEIKSTLLETFKVTQSVKEVESLYDFCDVTMEDVKSLNQNQER
ncbi:MAG: hypothetical protein ACRC6H_05900 [Culicoidibacterales bacterium]